MSISWGTRLAGAAVFAALAALAIWRSDSPVSAEDKPKPTDQAALPPDLDMVPREAAAFATVRVAEIWNNQAAKIVRQDMAKTKPDQLRLLEKGLGVDPAEVERATVVLPNVPAIGQENLLVSVFVATTKPYDKAKVLEALLPGATEVKHRNKTIHIAGAVAVYFANDRTFMISLTKEVEQTIERINQKDLQGLQSEALQLAAAGKHLVVGSVNPEPFDRALSAINPPELQPFLPLLKAKVVTATLDLGSEIQLDARMAFENADRAKDADKALQGQLAAAKFALPLVEKEAIKTLNDSPKLLKLFQLAVEAFKNMPVNQKDTDIRLALHVKANLTEVANAWIEGVAKANKESARITSANNLKQIVLALHNYHSAMAAFPPHAIYSKDGKPLLSWRVLILPYVEQDQLYKEFRLDEPWDSAHNKKLLARMPRLYASVHDTGKDSDKTFYQAFVGKGAAFEGQAGLRIADFTDGTSNTVMVAEAGEAVPWTKPDDLVYDAKKPLPKLGGLFPNGLHFAFADGSVRFMEKDIKETKLRAYITRNGGEVIEADK